MSDYQEIKANDEEKPNSFFKKANAIPITKDGEAQSPEVAAEKRKTLIAILLALGILQTLYMNLASFLPIYAEQYFVWVDESKIGLILAMFQVAYLIVAPIVGQYLQFFGRKNMILAGYIICIFATVGFGLCAKITPKQTSKDQSDKGSKLFFGISMAIRFIQGIGDSMVATSAYSIVSIEFPHKREVYIGYCQTSVGLGLLMGPVIGTSIYAWVQYEKTFYILAGVLVLSLLTAIFMLPNRLNTYTNDKPNEVVLTQDINARPSIQGPRPQGLAERNSVDMIALAKVSERYSRRSNVLMAQVTFKIFFTNLRAMTAIISAMFAMIFMLFYEPIFTPFLVNQYGFPKEKVGYTLAIGCFTYAVASPIVGMLCSKFQRKYITLMAFFLCGGSLLMFGPSLALGIKPTLAWTLVGDGCLGFSVAFLFVPLLPEIISAVSEKEGLENSPFLSDKASGIYNAAYGVGNCLAPIIGGGIAASRNAAANSKTEGFRFTCDVMAFSSITFGVLYLLLSVIQGLSSGNKNKNKITEDSLIADLGPQAKENSLTLEFEYNQRMNTKSETII